MNAVERKFNMCQHVIDTNLEQKTESKDVYIDDIFQNHDITSCTKDEIIKIFRSELIKNKYRINELQEKNKQTNDELQCMSINFFKLKRKHNVDNFYSMIIFGFILFAFKIF